MGSIEEASDGEADTGDVRPRDDVIGAHDVDLKGSGMEAWCQSSYSCSMVNGSMLMLVEAPP